MKWVVLRQFESRRSRHNKKRIGRRILGEITVAIREAKAMLCSYLAVAFCVVLSGCVNPHYSATHEQVEQRIASARTRADHQGLAQFFDQEAIEAKHLADKHRAMAKSYTERIWTGRGSWIHPREHCDRLVEIYEKSALENKALGALHREMALAVGE